jgi:hypothetical protein
MNRAFVQAQWKQRLEEARKVSMWGQLLFALRDYLTWYLKAKYSASAQATK